VLLDMKEQHLMVESLLEKFPLKLSGIQKKEKELISNPNMNNNSVRRKLAKNPNKYQVVNL